MDKIKLDVKDKKILYQLDVNARESIGQIARKVGLSKEATGYRIKKLETTGIIKNYYTIIDTSKLGYFSFRVYIKLIDTTPKTEREMINFLNKNKKTFYVVSMDGQFNINFGIWVKDIYEFDDFYKKFKENYKRYIGSEKISVFTRAHHLHREYLLEKEKTENKIESFGKSKQEKYDELDSNILTILSSNARIHIKKISDKLKTPERTIAFRIKQLEKKKIIQGYRALLNLELLGYEYYKVDFTLKNTSKLNELNNYAYLSPNIVYIDEMIAGSDFEFDIEVKNKEQFLKIINEIRTKFPDVREWNYFTLREYHKLLYFPA